MLKLMKKIVMFIVLSLSFFNLANFNIKSYAFEEENKLDKLIYNKSNQEDIKRKINELKESLDVKIVQKKDIENEDNSDIVKVSFVENKKLLDEDYIDLEISQLEDEIKTLDKNLEESMIDSVRIEKSIEEEKRGFLKENNLDFIKGAWPLESYKDISSGYGYRTHPITKEKDFHRGIDIPAPKDTYILSSDDGIVIFSGTQNGYGNVIKIKHFDGKKTTYAHNTTNLVKEGDIVKKGQEIGKVGSTGDSTGNHVHFETKINDENINPTDALQK